MNENKPTKVYRAHTMRVHILCLLTASAGAFLGGCSDHQEDIMRELQALTESTKPSIKPLTAGVNYQALNYDSSALDDPFSPSRVSVIAGPKDVDISRKRQPLEAYELDDIKLVGTLQVDGRRHATVMVDDQIFNISVGHFLGGNHGQVIAIAENAMTVREKVLEGNNQWVSREVRLSMDESQEGKQ